MSKLEIVSETTTNKMERLIIGITILNVVINVFFAVN